MTQNRVVAVVGMCGAGKSIVADKFVAAGYQFLRFGQIVLDIVKERGLAPTEENERPIREEVREKHGMAAMAILNLDKIKAMLEAGNVVIDGLYSWAEYKVLRETFGELLVVIAVFVPPHIRYDRISKRQLTAEDTSMRNRPVTEEQAASRDQAEIENSDKGGPIAMADYTLTNTESLDAFNAKIDTLIEQL